jgi:two-component system LytT family sensor kinase
MPRRLRSGLIVFAISTIIGLYFATEARLFDPAPVRKDWWGALGVNLAYYWAWGAAVPLVAALSRRFPLVASGRRLLNFGALVATGTVVTVAVITLTVFIVCPAPTLRIVTFRVTANFYSGFLIYWLILFVVLSLDYHRRYQNRELRAARLEQLLSEARLNALRMQLNPHFLFNSLNSVSSLMYVDTAAADTMIRKLGELLRLSLDRTRGPEVRLQQEVEFVERYLDIEHVRFEDRLQVRFEIDPETLHALVPAFVLQPLVENAVHHAVAPREGGRVEIAARRDQGWLRLAVTDDGPGLKAGSTEGVGLANTRSRLEHLYGDSDALRLVSLEDGRLRVEIVVPFRRDSSVTVGVDAPPRFAE